jgi:hypothetical protein
VEAAAQRSRIPTTPSQAVKSPGEPHVRFDVTFESTSCDAQEILPGESSVESNILLRQSTPLPAPEPRKPLLPAWMSHKDSQTEFTRSGSPRQQDDQAFLSNTRQPTPSSQERSRRRSSRHVSSAPSSTLPSPVEDQSLLVDRPLEQSHGAINAPLATRGRLQLPTELQHAASDPPSHVSNMNQPVHVHVGNLHIYMSPAQVSDAPVESRRNLLKRAISKSYNRAQSKKAAVAYQGNQVVSDIISGLESLGIEVGRRVTNEDMSPHAIDEAYDELAVQSGTPDPELAARLNALPTRQSVSKIRSLFESRIDENGSRAPLRSAPLKVMNPTPILNERRPNLAAAISTRRRPLPEQHPVPSPAADRDHTQSVDSMRVQPDTPSHQNRLLARTFQHPPANADWGNVPTATQSLPHTNSQALMGANCFGDARTEMPIYSPRAPYDKPKPEVDRSLTPNTRAEKKEKNAMKAMRGPSAKTGDPGLNLNIK